MKKRQRKKKFAALDASGVKEIAAMQARLDEIENPVWRLSQMVNGRDDGRSIICLTDKRMDYATNVIYKFIKEQKENPKVVIDFKDLKQVKPWPTE